MGHVWEEPARLKDILRAFTVLLPMTEKRLSSGEVKVLTQTAVHCGTEADARTISELQANRSKSYTARQGLQQIKIDSYSLKKHQLSI